MTRKNMNNDSKYRKESKQEKKARIQAAQESREVRERQMALGCNSILYSSICCWYKSIKHFSLT